MIDLDRFFGFIDKMIAMIGDRTGEHDFHSNMATSENPHDQYFGSKNRRPILKEMNFITLYNLASSEQRTLAISWRI